MARVTWTRPAQQQSREIQRYIALDSPTAAAAMVRRLRRDVERLAQFPQLGRIVPEYGNPEIRELIVAPYRVIYRYQPANNRVQVIGVIHGSRSLPPLAGL